MSFEYDFLLHIITLSTYLNALVCRSAIIVVGMSYGYSLPPGGSVKLGRKDDLRCLIVTCVTMGLVGIFVDYVGGTTTSGNVVETNI